MKKFIYAFLVCSGISSLLVAREPNFRDWIFHERGCHQHAGCTPTPLKRAGQIKESGIYCLTRDIEGTFEIVADNVILNLNGHVVKASNAPAITAANVRNVSIQNGAVTKALHVAISFTDCYGIKIENVQAYENNRALALTRCQNSDLTAIKAYSNSNTENAVVLIEDCKSVQLSDVEVCNNTKALPVDDETDAGEGILAIIHSSNISLNRCLVNDNERLNDTVRFSPLAVVDCEGVSCYDCQSNDNHIDVSDSHGLNPMFFYQCFDSVLDGCQVCRNSLAETSKLLNGILMLESSRNIITNSQVNGNFLVKADGPIPTLQGISVFFGNDTMILNCQICSNFIEDGSDESLITLVGVSLLGISDPIPGFGALENRTMVENCQINDNAIMANGVGHAIGGLVVQSVEDATVRNVSCSGNHGGSISAGVIVQASPNSERGLRNSTRKMKIVDCTASDNQSRVLSAGILFAGGQQDSLIGVVESSDVIGCQTHRNMAIEGNGYGILFQNTESCSVMNCQMHLNSTTGFYAGKAANRVATADTANINCLISNCSAIENGVNGFDLSNDGVINDFLLENNVALANGQYGFVHHPKLLFSTFLGNFARDNGSDNFLINGGTIQLHTLNLANGVYEDTAGDPRLTKLSNVEAVYPPIEENKRS